MSEQFSQNPSAFSSQANTDVVALIKKMQQQLDSLERKIDTLVRQQSQERPFREKRFSKPFRPFGNSQHHGKREHDHSPRERGFEQGQNSSRPSNFSSRDGERRQGNQHRGYGPKKKSFYHNRKDRG